jgi:hypothetical protein
MKIQLVLNVSNILHMFLSIYNILTIYYLITNIENPSEIHLMVRLIKYYLSMLPVFRAR